MAGIIGGLKEGFGQLVDAHAHAAGNVLDFVGLDGAAKAVDDWGDDIAADLGTAVGEKNLGESDDPKDLVHGDTEAIAQSAAHLRKFAAAFESTAAGLSRMDSDHWQGKAADAFRAKFGPQPVAWRVTADACEAAAGALESLAGTIQWAQGQARQAIEEYRRAQQASKDAADAYNRQIADYNRSVDAYNRAAEAGQSPTAPTKPGAFHDPGADGRRHAAELLLAARKQRVSAADDAERAIRAATTAAPKEPGLLDRAGMALVDAPKQAAVGLLHFEGGLVKGAVDIVKFGRGLNPMDPYNLTHPAVYLDHVNSTVAGLVRTGNHPMDLVTGMVGSGWGKDPAEAGGKLVFNIVSGIATGGGSEAAVVAERAAIAAAEKAAARTAAENAAVRGGEKAAADAAEHGAENAAKAADDAANAAGHPPKAPDDPLAVATDRTVDIDSISPHPVWREGNEPLYRFDNRSPDKVFSDGFEPLDPTNTDLKGYVDGGVESAFVGTTRRADLDFPRMYRYDVDAPGGIDVNVSMPGHRRSHEHEVAFPGGIRTENIKGAWELAPDGTRTWHPNPNYNPHTPTGTAPTAPEPAPHNPGGLPPGWTLQ